MSAGRQAAHAWRAGDDRSTWVPTVASAGRMTRSLRDAARRSITGLMGSKAAAPLSSGGVSILMLWLPALAIVGAQASPG
jgi:hypothetical protein